MKQKPIWFLKYRQVLVLYQFGKAKINRELPIEKKINYLFSDNKRLM